jgi:DNA polymerase III epsilon subunit-like protein
MTNHNYKFVFDTETSGLPYKERGSNYDYTNLDHFNSSRLLSISWLLINDINEIVEKKTYYIKPDDFEISEASINIHGLTKEFLNENGITIHEVLLNLNGLFTKYNINLLIAHNINFDINILKSELYRYQYNITLSKIARTETFCTMLGSQVRMNVYKWPKLSEAYTYFYNEEIANAHDAEYDTLHCYKIYLKLCDYINRLNV